MNKYYCKMGTVKTNDQFDYRKLTLVIGIMNITIDEIG